MKSKKKKNDLIWNIVLLLIGIFFIFITISAGLYGIDNMVKYKSIKEFNFWALISIVIFWKLGDLLKDVTNSFIDIFEKEKSK